MLFRSESGRVPGKVRIRTSIEKLSGGVPEKSMANQEDLAKLLTLEQGKPLKESRGEIAYGSSFL